MRDSPDIMPAAVSTDPATPPACGERVCILHIGMHKTGTSSIQRTIADNLDELRNGHGIASYRRHLNHSALAPAFVDDLSQVRSNLTLGLEQPADVYAQAVAAVQELEQSLEQQQPKRLLLSGEGFSKLPETAVPRLKQFLARHFDRVQVAVYVREPFSYANSAGAQRIKGGSTFKNLILDTLVHQEIYSSHPDSSSVLPTYRYRIEKYIAAFGRENVQIVPYERDVLRGRDVVNDFFWRFFAIESADLGRQPARENEAPTAAALYILEYLNREEPIIRDGWLNTGRSITLPTKLQKMEGDKRFSIPGFNYDEFAGIVQPDVEWLRDITDGAIDYSLKPPKPSPAPVATDLLPVAKVLNRQSQEIDWQYLRTAFFREMWRIATGQVDDTAELERIIGVCTELSFLPNAAHNLRLAKLPDMALLVEERAAYLRSRQP